jgi:hypothetical protein
MSQVGRSREIKWGLSILEEPAVSARAGQVHSKCLLLLQYGVDRKKALSLLHKQGPRRARQPCTGPINRAAAAPAVQLAPVPASD